MGEGETRKKPVNLQQLSPIVMTVYTRRQASMQGSGSHSSPSWLEAGVAMAMAVVVVLSAVAVVLMTIPTSFLLSPDMSEVEKDDEEEDEGGLHAPGWDGSA